MGLRTLYETLKHIGRTASPRDADTYGELLKSFVGRSVWCIDTMATADGLVEITGWALAEPGQPFAFTLNGRRFERIEHGGPREDIQRLFWFWPNAAASGFRCRTTVAANEGQPLTFDFVDADSMQPLTGRHSYVYREPRLDLPLPSRAQRLRVQGSEDGWRFMFEGVTTLHKVQDVVRRLTARDLAGFRNILDWGCGCGRLTRHLMESARDRVTGADIDRENVEWCSRHLPSGTFATIPLRPPTDFPVGHFDLVLGLSVFTHLSEADQDLWLIELARITGPGAILLLSTRGRTAVAQSAFPEERTRQWLEKGFVCDLSFDLDAVLPLAEKEYYRTSYHTVEYVRNRWTKEFEILDVIEGYVSNVQDLVVLRKRAR